MSPQRSAQWVRRWVALYTRGLPAEVRAERADEIESDLWGQMSDAAEAGRREASLAGEIYARLVLGIPADLGWRLEQRGTPRAGAPERNPTMFPRVISALAMVGGVAWAVWLTVGIFLGEAAWTRPMFYLVMAAAALGSLGLSLATVGLVFGNIERLRPVPAFLGAVGGAAGMLTIGGFYAGGLVVLPIGSALLMHDLARLGVIGTWRGRLHAAAGIASAAPALVLLPTNGVVPNAIPYVALIAAAIAYGLTWIAIGWSLRDGAWMPEAPVAGP